MPETPDASVCILDPSNKRGQCVAFSQRDIPDVHAEKVYFEPIDGMMNYLAFSPESWAEIESYIRQLRSRAEQCQ